MGTPMTVAVFGATSAIARALARLYAGRGAALFLAGRRQEALEAEARDLKVRGAARVVTACADLAEIEAHAPLLARLEAEFGTPDIALFAWGTLSDQARAEADPAYAAREIQTNFTAMAALLLPLAAMMRARGQGTLAVISSVAGDRGRASNYVYGSAKGGLQRFLEGLRHSLHGTGVTVLDIRPGFVDTGMTAHLENRSGPLWASPEKVAGDIEKAIGAGRQVLYTPWFWQWIMRIVKTLPRPLFHRTRF